MKSTHEKFELLSGSLHREGIGSDAAEVQGMLCGMLAGGMALENRSWMEPLADFIHQGQEFSEETSQLIHQLYDELVQQLMENDFALILCLPEDKAPINDRGRALIKWVQGFMLGFGVEQQDLTACSEEVKEALQDFAEISKMDEEMIEDEESEKALFEVMEYIRISAMLCFNELGHSAGDQQAEPKTLH